MHHTRRFLAHRMLLGTLVAPLGAFLPGKTAAQGLPAPESDIRALLRRARDSSASANQRGRVALDRTLERVEDLGLETMESRVIVVNIAAAELIVYDAGREVLRSRIVVGAARTRTPQLASFVTSVRTNPPWYVPTSIEAEIRAAGATGFRVVNGRFIQPPGPTNPLGPIRIGLVDSDGIFLHGTNSPGLFARRERALSHGCVRVERIRELAAWVLDTTPAAIAATLATGRTLELIPPREVAVVLAYLTAWPDAGGRVVAYGDPYGLDAPGSRRAPYRRIARPVPQTPAEAEAAARTTTPDENPL